MYISLSICNLFLHNNFDEKIVIQARLSPSLSDHTEMFQEYIYSPSHAWSSFKG